MDGITTNYTLDLNAGLTQVLSDGTNTYLYGNGRIAQTSNTTEYFLGDALGSVRQLVDATGAITLAQSYAPYGDTVTSTGDGVSAYQYTGEARDDSGLTFLRARYLDSGVGRFTSRDTWGGDYNRPLSLNRWEYVYANPINLVDPSGYCGHATTPGELAACELYLKYGISVGSFQDSEKVLILETVVDFANLLGGAERFKNNVALTSIREGWATGNYAIYYSVTKSITIDYRWYLPIIGVRPGIGVEIGLCPPDIEDMLDLPEGSLPGREFQSKFVLAHEIGHAFHNKNPRVFSSFSQNVDLPYFRFAKFSDNPLISRNAGRAGFQFEVFSDVIAAKLYSPSLLNADMRNWIDNDMPGVLQ